MNRRNHTHNYKDYHNSYSQLGITGSYILAFRDIPLLVQGLSGKALDYGCGPARSTQFLRALGFETCGVDISEDMLESARKLDPSGEYRKIDSGKIPYPNNHFDLVFSSMVFMEIPTLKEIRSILREMKRVLKPNGKIVFLTSPATDFTGDWLSFSYNFPENDKVFKSGDLVKLLIKPDIILYDYFWSGEDYKKAVKRAGLQIEKIHVPLGNDKDGVKWRDEDKKGYFVLYVLHK